MTPFPARSLLFGLCCGLLLTACDDDRIHNICANYPALCQDLVDDGWCRYERSDIIRARYYLQAEGTERRQYELMRSLERYLKCAERSTNIEYKRAREQKSPRVEGMLAVGEQLAQLDAATRNANDPTCCSGTGPTTPTSWLASSFWRWRGNPCWRSPSCNWHSAASMPRASRKGHRADAARPLPLPGREQVNYRISPPSAPYMGQKQYGQAYLWGKVSESFQNAAEVSATRFSLYHSLSKQEQESLDSQAAALVEQLKSGTYRP